MKAPLRLAIVGTGAMAEHHARRFAAIEGVEVSATVDRDPERAASFAAKAGIPSIYRDVERLAIAGSADAVAISTRDVWHFESAIAALSRGLPVFCEKPMAREASEALAMVKAADASGLPTMVNFSKRNGGFLALARAIIDSGEIGKVESAEFFYLQDWLHSRRWGDWERTPRWQWRLDDGQSSHGVLGDLGSHCVDAMLFLIGAARPLACVARRFEAPPTAAWRPGQGAEVFASAIFSAIACDATLGLSFEARASVDAFGFRVRGSLGDIAMNADLSRDELAIHADDGSVSRMVKPEKRPSTYERFVRVARGAIDPLAEEPLDFARGLEVARIVDSLSEMAASGLRGRLAVDAAAAADATGADFRRRAASTMASRARR